jgi:hypothetical protein
LSLSVTDQKNMSIMCNHCSGENERERRNIHKDTLIDMFNRFPEGIEFDNFELPKLRGMIHSDVMGGNIMKPVAKDNMSPKTIDNSIEEEVLKMNI